MAQPPSGTVTLLFTDIEGSTRLVQHLGDRYPAALAEHQQLLRAAFGERGGREIDSQGDSFFVAFGRAEDAVAAAVEGQRALEAHLWPDGGAVRVRMGLHSGEPIPVADRYVGLDVHRAARICAAGHGGQVLLSHATRALVEHDLPTGVSLHDLGVHRLKDLPHPERMFQLLIPGLSAEFPPLRSLDARPNNLPLPRGLLVGREAEVAAVAQLLLRGDVGLVTLTGPGGTGKTRLALQVGTELLDHFRDGVYFVALAPVSDPNVVASAIVEVLGMRETPGRPLSESLKDYLRDRMALLVLDNFEQVLDAGPLVAELLSAAPKLQVLVTSRAVLHLYGEHAFPVPPLALPPRGPRPSAELVAESEAVRLFVDRARAAKPDFAVTADNAAAVAEICHRLDGLPLAIELAAARIRLLPPAALLERLERRLPLLTGGPRDLPARQQTLRNAVAWSYDLLGEDERSLFRCLGAFVGGCALKSVEAVCQAADALESDLLDGVASLVDKSLLRQDERGDEIRFRMLETIREYAAEQLEASGEAAATRRRVAEHYLELAEQAAPELRRPGQVDWLARLEREHDNLRAAMEWFRQSGEAEQGLRLASALWWFLTLRGYFAEARGWLEEMLSLGGASARSRARAWALSGAGLAGWWDHDLAISRAHLEESIEIWRELADEPGLAFALGCLSLTSLAEGDLPGARSLLEESLAVAERTEDAWGVALSKGVLGRIALRVGDYAEAESRLEESLAARRRIGDRWVIAQNLNGLGDLARCLGDHARAQGRYEDSLALARELGDRLTMASLLHNLGYVALAQGDPRGASARFQESIALFRGLGDRPGVAECLAGLAGSAAAQQPEAAARLFGAAADLLEAVGAPMSATNRADHERSIAAARALLDQEPFEQAWAEGRTLTQEQAIEYALEVSSQATAASEVR